MPEVSLNDMLAVTEKVRLVSLAEQPNLPILIQNLPEADYAILLELTKQTNQDATLKEYILARSQAPTQSLDEIVSGLDKKKLHKIDKDHILINLIHAHNNNLITAYEISTLIRHYITMGILSIRDPSLGSMEFVDCLGAGRPGDRVPLNNIIQEAVIQSKILPEEKSAQLHCLLFEYPKNRILQQAIIRKYQCFENPLEEYQLGGDLVLLRDKKLNSTSYTIPLEILSKIYLMESKPEEHCMLPMPIFGCYSYELLRKYSCQDAHVEYRPVTLPTYLPLYIKSLFYGVRKNQYDEVEYNLYSSDVNSKKHFLDMTMAHETRAQTFGVMNHDEYHVKQANREQPEEAKLRNHLVKVLEQCLEHEPSNMHLHNMYHSLLDVGVKGMIGEALQTTGDETRRDMLMTFKLMLDKLQQAEFKAIFLQSIYDWCSIDYSDLEGRFSGFGKAIYEWADVAPYSKLRSM